MQYLLKPVPLLQNTIDLVANTFSLNTFALYFNYVFYQVVTGMILTAEYFILPPETEMKFSDTLSENYRKRDIYGRKSRTIMQAMSCDLTCLLAVLTLE